jgi:ABC-type antimicrobial peptide transport system permease subunit
MMALGTRPRAIVTLVLCESLVLTAAGLAAGLALGLPLVEYFALRGLDLSRYAEGLQSIPGLTGVIHPLFVPASLLVPLLLLLVLSLLAAFYPAWRAARLQPAAAIRHA